MKVKKQITIGVVFVLFLVYGGISFYFSNQLVYFQPKTYEEDKKHYKINSIEQVDLKNPEDITIEINGVKLSGWYFTGKNQCGVIFHHGYKSTRFRMLTYVPLRNIIVIYYFLMQDTMEIVQVNLELLDIMKSSIF